MKRLWIVLLALALTAGQCDVATPTPAVPTPDCQATMAPLYTRVISANETVVAMETTVSELYAVANELWFQCCAVLTAIPTIGPEATYTPAPTYTPWPTYTPALQPTPTETPEPTPAQITDKMCLACADSAYCGAGYECHECGAAMVCVRTWSPHADCNVYCVTPGAVTK